MKKTDPEFVGALISQFATVTRQRDKNEAEADVADLRSHGNGKFKFHITIAGDASDWDSSTCHTKTEGTLSEALKTALLNERKEHPGYMETRYITVQIITLSGKKILLPEILWQDTLHEVFHELDYHHVDNLKMTPFGFEEVKHK